MTPIKGQYVMSFIENQPMRSTRSCTQRSEAWEKLPEEPRPVRKCNTEEIETYVHFRILEYAQHLIDAYSTIRIA